MLETVVITCVYVTVCDSCILGRPKRGLGESLTARGSERIYKLLFSVNNEQTALFAADKCSGHKKVL